ncbi:hypothetical protein KP509_14G080400 [Ceratopteris richardii]|uniref:Uncharacterized protein n=1 Tax=Ceratopteris richardii TaxID=49495 RepID=A0A8T2TBS8_CERRI|nr:hypothetical protein KP509_14G080400 [Ceratopteris richardii]KAH7416203.1 hypothetical protein KP509_14G080400 [Ceratopteris richardii]KAH7416204.1 hypothetical protein KP509_14G080400 [Ceratopteris richardii]KAH7416205.1 hypothetical protein KP509_14G080400 [Ceratopteris richardii]KAH7416206.1 hypothetical protein KP509_14G080400 [Ceratopteris richardii]
MTFSATSTCLTHAIRLYLRRFHLGRLCRTRNDYGHGKSSFMWSSCTDSKDLHRKTEKSEKTTIEGNKRTRS